MPSVILFLFKNCCRKLPFVPFHLKALKHFSINSKKTDNFTVHSSLSIGSPPLRNNLAFLLSSLPLFFGEKPVFFNYQSVEILGAINFNENENHRKDLSEMSNINMTLGPELQAP